MITASDLCVSVGPVAILDKVCLQANAGATVGVVGHNGAGKTTLMRALIGILPARSGTITLCGRDMTFAAVQPRVRLGVGYMPEDRRLIPDLTVRQNILLPMEVAVRADAAPMLERLLGWIPELKPLIDRKANQLSGGQQKLAALGRAIGYGTHALLLDEPFEGVAPALAERLVHVLRELRTTGRAPTILVTASEQTHLRGLCDEFYAIERGRLRLAAENEITHGC